MIREEFYTELTVNTFAKLSIDTDAKEYEITKDLPETEIDMEMVDFLAPKVFDALITGLEAQGYKKI